MNETRKAFEKWAKEHATHLELKRDGNWLERYWSSSTHHAFNGFQAAAQIWNDSWELKAELADAVSREAALREAIKEAMGCLESSCELDAGYTAKVARRLDKAITTAYKTLKEALTEPADTECEYRNYGTPTCRHDLLVCSQPSCNCEKPRECPKLSGEQRVLDTLEAGDPLHKLTEDMDVKDMCDQLECGHTSIEDDAENM